MQVKVIKSGFLQTNTYIINMEDKCIIIDPAFSYSETCKYIEQNKFIVLGILLTHGHFDHIDSCNELSRKFNCKIYMSINDLNLAINPSMNGSKNYLKRDIFVNKDYIITFEKEIILKLDNFMIDVLFTPGHSKGSCCFLIDNKLFSGDTLFKNAIGRVDLPEGDKNEMDKSLRYIFNLNNDVLVFPGHGDETSILKERNRYI